MDTVLVFLLVMLNLTVYPLIINFINNFITNSIPSRPAHLSK